MNISWCLSAEINSVIGPCIWIEEFLTCAFIKFCNEFDEFDAANTINLFIIQSISVLWGKFSCFAKDAIYRRRGYNFSSFLFF